MESSLAWWAGRLEVVRDFDGTADQAAEQALAEQRQRQRRRRRRGQRVKEKELAGEEAAASDLKEERGEDERGEAGAQGQSEAREEEAGSKATGGEQQREPEEKQPEEEEAEEQEEEPQEARRYVLGFHPHGLYPTGAGFVPLMPSVQAAFPGRCGGREAGAGVRGCAGVRGGWPEPEGLGPNSQGVEERGMDGLGAGKAVRLWPGHCGAGAWRRGVA